MGYFVWGEFVFEAYNLLLSRAILLLALIEDDCYFWGVDIRLSTRCKIWFTLGLFANYFSLKSVSLSPKSHMNVR